jgi:hypothetical protein
MAEITYAVILDKNLKLNHLEVPQMEVVLDVTGADPDPLTLQQIRDEPSINQCFQDRRKNINDFIEKVDGQLAKIKDKKQVESLISALNKKIDGELNTLEDELQKRVDVFVQKQKQNVNDLFWARAKIATRIVKALIKVGKGVVELPGKATAAFGAGLTGAGVFLSLVALKSLYSSVTDIKGAFDEVKGALEGEREQYNKLKKAVTELKKIKKPNPVPQDKIEDVEKLLGPYGARLLGVDSSAKSAATKLDKHLKELEAGKFRKKEAQKAAEDVVHEMILKIIELSKNVEEGRKLLQSAKDKVKDALTRVKKDTSIFWTLAGPLWKVVDGLMDAGEKTLEAENTASFWDNCLEVLKDKIEEEMEEAEEE